MAVRTIKGLLFYDSTVLTAELFRRTCTPWLPEKHAQNCMLFISTPSPWLRAEENWLKCRGHPLFPKKDGG